MSSALSKLILKLKSWSLSQYLMAWLSVLFGILLIQQLISGSLLKTGPELVAAGSSQCQITSETYGQCGGTVGLEGLDAHTTYEVTKTTNADCSVSYTHVSKGQQPGVCGNPSTPQISCPDDVTYCDNGELIHKHGGRAYNPASASETSAKDSNGCIYAFDQVGTCGAQAMVTTCKGQTISWSQLESELHGANYPGPYGDQYHQPELEAYNHAACPPTQSSQAITCNSISASVNPNPESIGQGLAFSLSGDGSTWFSDDFGGGAASCNHAGWNGSGGTTTCTATSHPGTYTWTHTWKHCIGNVNNCSNTCSVLVNYTITAPSSPSTVVSSSAGTQNSNSSSLQCPAGTSVSSSTGSTLVCITNVNNNTTTSAGGQTSSNTQTVVESNEVRQLPETGLPIAAWAITGLVPFGMKLRKFNQTRLEKNADSIWKEKESRSTFK